MPYVGILHSANGIESKKLHGVANQICTPEEHDLIEKDKAQRPMGEHEEYGLLEVSEEYMPMNVVHQKIATHVTESTENAYEQASTVATKPILRSASQCIFHRHSIKFSDRAHVAKTKVPIKHQRPRHHISAMHSIKYLVGIIYPLSLPPKIGQISPS